VLVSGGYPGTYPKGVTISGLPASSAGDQVVVFHAGTRRGGGGEVLTHGGRVLGVTARGEDLSAARQAAYAVALGISWRGMDYRKDIANRALASQLEVNS
jgi:phosphoribosylamine--glycine ligase